MFRLFDLEQTEYQQVRDVPDALVPKVDVGVIRTHYIVVEPMDADPFDMVCWLLSVCKCSSDIGTTPWLCEYRHRHDSGAQWPCPSQLPTTGASGGADDTGGYPRR